ncbi:MAG: RNA polymerase sigma factor [Opitutaceae bacterium]
MSPPPDPASAASFAELPLPLATAESEHWFAEQVQPHEAELRSYVRHHFPKIRDVDDLVQESLLRVWRAKAGGRIVHARAYLFSTARNVAYALFRHPGFAVEKTTSDVRMDDVVDGRPNIPEQVNQTQEIEVLREAIDLLPVRCREIFILRKLHRVPQREIACRLGLSEKTIQAQISRGTKKCVQYLRDRGVTRP